MAAIAHDLEPSSDVLVHVTSTLSRSASCLSDPLSHGTKKRTRTVHTRFRAGEGAPLTKMIVNIVEVVLSQVATKRRACYSQIDNVVDGKLVGIKTSESRGYGLRAAEPRHLSISGESVSARFVPTHPCLHAVNIRRFRLSPAFYISGIRPHFCSIPDQEILSGSELTFGHGNARRLPISRDDST